MKVSIIVRCFNEEKYIEKLLQGIVAQDYKDIEIIVVDSGSTDNTLHIAKRYAHKIVNISPSEFTFGYALNKGCDVAEGKILLFASAHVYPVHTTWIENMTSPFKNDKVGLVYGRQIGDENSKYSEKRLFEKWFPGQSNNKQLHPFCNNANCAIRKQMWVNKQYDETLTGLEDLAWAKHIFTLGYHIVYAANATIVHVHEETPKRILNRYRREAIALQNILPNSSFSILDFLKLTLSNIVSDFYHAFHEKVFLKEFKSIPMFRTMQFWGTYKGYRQKGEITRVLRERFYYPNSLKIKTENEENKDRFVDYSQITL